MSDKKENQIIESYKEKRRKRDQRYKEINELIIEKGELTKIEILGYTISLFEYHVDFIPDDYISPFIKYERIELNYGYLYIIKISEYNFEIDFLTVSSKDRESLLKDLKKHVLLLQEGSI